MLDSTTEDMAMVLALAMPVLAILDTDMDILPTDTPPLDTMVRDLLMLSQRPRLMLDSTTEDMAMVLALAMLVLAMRVLAMLDTDMDILPMDTPPLDTMERDLLMLSQRPRQMLDFTTEDMAMVLDMLVLVMPDMAMDILPMVLATVDTIMVKPFPSRCDKAKAQDNH